MTFFEHANPRVKEGAIYGCSVFGLVVSWATCACLIEPQAFDIAVPLSILSLIMIPTGALTGYALGLAEEIAGLAPTETDNLPKPK